MNSIDFLICSTQILGMCFISLIRVFLNSINIIGHLNFIEGITTVSAWPKNALWQSKQSLFINRCLSISGRPARISTWKRVLKVDSIEWTTSPLSSSGSSELCKSSLIRGDTSNCSRNDVTPFKISSQSLILRLSWRFSSNRSTNTSRATWLGIWAYHCYKHQIEVILQQCILNINIHIADISLTLSLVNAVSAP